MPNELAWHGNLSDAAPPYFGMKAKVIASQKQQTNISLSPY
jgi:hypothetical protein